MCMVDRDSFGNNFFLIVALHYLVYNMETVHDMFLLKASPKNLFLKYETGMVYYGLHILH